MRISSCLLKKKSATEKAGPDGFGFLCSDRLRFGGWELSRLASRDEMHYKRDHREDEEDVNQESGYVEEEEEASPCKDQEKSEE